MKNLKKNQMFRKMYLGVLGLSVVGLMVVSCSSDDDNGSPNNPPEPFMINGIIGGEVFPKANFTWQAATDPDNDTVTYDVYLVPTGETLTVFPGATNISETSYTVPAGQALQAGETYSCRVLAKDGNGGETFSTNTLQVTVVN